jgi:hypothetical protein
MSYLQELIAITHQDVLSFFVSGLKDVCSDDVDTQELMYNASVLAHYAQTSTHSTDAMPTPTSLMDIFDRFVCGTDLISDSDIAEIAGTQCLLMTGFFENQMGKRHNLRWYRDLGAGYFHQAATMSRQSAKAHVLHGMAKGFEPWRQRHTQLSHALQHVQLHWG